MSLGFTCHSASSVNSSLIFFFLILAPLFLCQPSQELPRLSTSTRDVTLVLLFYLCFSSTFPKTSRTFSLLSSSLKIFKSFSSLIPTLEFWHFLPAYHCLRLKDDKPAPSFSMLGLISISSSLLLTHEERGVDFFSLSITVQDSMMSHGVLLIFSKHFLYLLLLHHNKQHRNTRTFPSLFSAFGI